MPRLVFGRDRNVVAWVAGRLPDMGDGTFGLCVAIGVEGDNGEPLAGVVFHNWVPPSIEISMAASSPRWATRRTIGDLLRFPFGQLGCGRVTICVSVANDRMMALAPRLGFVREGTIREGRPDGGDVAVWGMLRSEAARWTGE